MDDWQDHALSTRHMHNRNSRRPSGKGKKGGQFDVRKAFGEYEVKCASWERALGDVGDADRQDEDAAFELLRLTDDGQGVLGELVLPGLLRAAVVLAASRRGLTLLTRSLAGEEEEEQEDSGSDGEAASDGDEHGSDEEENDGNAPPNRFETFEKNSFRSPKFWLAWNGALSTPRPDSPPPSLSPSTSRKQPSSDSPPPSPTLHRTGSSFPPPRPTPSTHQAPAEGLGYVVFTGPDCRKFKGTLNCKELGWKDVAFSGFKSVSRSESDRQLLWGGRDVETGWREGAEEEEGERGARLDGRRRVVFD
ncbi:hypothetical protein SVAN01_02899 [Stagonosporopsis vannaccii]|nr:hypothetical protein SVAN01_02899 [Stagonosporopsis vannaccii]